MLLSRTYHVPAAASAYDYQAMAPCCIGQPLDRRDIMVTVVPRRTEIDDLEIKVRRHRNVVGTV
jgi:hypothetical protein